MTTAKAKNGNVAQEALADASRMAEEAKEMVNSWVEASGKAVEEAKPVLAAQQKVLENSYGIWAEAGKSYLDFVTKAATQSVAQSLAFQKEMFKIAQAGIKESQELWAAEQAFVFATIESSQRQIKDTAETMGKLFTSAK
ncbi:MAG: hypothetical protein FOGNACKC_04197 [Anaerolineae bacterium]|nr:hypothetical protein [Anaerolineae bacterium]